MQSGSDCKEIKFEEGQWPEKRLDPVIKSLYEVELNHAHILFKSLEK